ncbi:hypothetical protein [Dietzia natronolimnaea]|uniref:hypothetical protein n=1 Tax=Dietzia natronolimnaea TaxID=161920 RepID=UPI0015FDB02A|nr:hypothetical protein [Dietzia natronolimnaea]MBB1037404.1 hypothetical protein [Dietzia natronolimnaea]
MGRRIAYTRRTSLDRFEGLEGCYITWSPMTYAEKNEWLKTTGDATDDEAAINIGIKLIQDQFVDGRLRFEVGGKLEAATKDDIAELPVEVVDLIFADMTGVRYDADPLGVTGTETTSSTTSSETAPQTATNSSETQ